jgi:T5SS/PEP-CTERM-associated repeat protein
VHRIRDACLIAGLLAGVVLGSRPIQAQYTADYQTNLISGVTSNWAGDYLVGSNTMADALLLQSGGVLSNGFGYVGYEISSSNNGVLVTDSGSIWTNSSNPLYVGYSGAGNSLVISNGGQVASGYGYMGYNSSSSNNTALVVGKGSVAAGYSSVWKGGAVYVGYSGAGNNLVISNAGWVAGFGEFIGYNSSSRNNRVVVTGIGSDWGSGDLYAGYSGSGNSLVVSSGGEVDTGYANVGGSNSSSSNNCVLVTDNGSVWNISGGIMYIGLAGVGNSLVISNAGKVLQGGGVVYLGANNTSSNNSALVTGSGSVWSNTGTIYMGNQGSANSLVVDDGGRVLEVYGSDEAMVGYNSRYNQVLVKGSNSIWSMPGPMYLGFYGAGNSLVISNGGKVVNATGHVGYDVNSWTNRVRVAGLSSVWSNAGPLYIGENGRGNSLVISSGGQVADYDGSVGYNSITNTVRVTGSGSVWNNATNLWVGNSGSQNSLVIDNGGRVADRTGYVGYTYNSGPNSVLVTDAGSVWSNSGFLAVGYAAVFNSLVISNAGQAVSGFGYVGYNGVYHSVLVSDSGSVWSNSGSLTVGYSGAYNTLTISNGGQVVNSTGYLGYNNSGGHHNSVLATGSGSVWTNRDSLYIGWGGWYNSLVLSNSGRVVNSTGYVGYNSNSNSNDVLVADAAVWQNDVLHVGEAGAGNFMIVAGGTVLATNLVVGFNSSTCDNWVELDSGSVVVTNATGDAVLEVRNGTFTLNGGVLQVDTLVITNPCGVFVRNGGTLLYNSLVLDPNLSAVGDGIPNGWKQQYGLDPLDPNVANEDPDGDGLSNLQEFLAGSNPVADIKAITQEGNDIRVTWQAAATKTNALQATAGDDSGNYSNNFTDIFTATNTDGSVTNYLDAGAVTNFPSRFYRVRLVP